MQRDARTYGVDWAQRLREARRCQGLSQSALAQAVDCRQSAISMMERGHAAALSRETLARIADRLGVALDAPRPERDADSAAPSGITTGRPWCPNPDCPSNLPYAAGDTLLFWPSAQPAGLGRHCGYCGEVLESQCPNPDCRAPARSGACCMQCGTPWLSPPPEAADAPERWADGRRRRITDWLALRTAL